MRRIAPLALFLVLFVSTSAWAGEPPNQNDPCSSGGKDSCGTTGVGRYATYKYGLRWFGDYRGAVPDVDGATFCIDLRYWYPGKQYGYEERSPDGLRNRDGDAVSVQKIHRMAYALWTYGRSRGEGQQAAVMLYVHHLMGDGAPGEVDPSAPGGNVASTFNKIERQAARFAGPYTVTTSVPKGIAVGAKTTLTVTVKSSSGAAMRDTRVALSGAGASGLPSSAETGTDGVARVPFTATSDLKLTAKATLAAAQPDLYAPTRGKTARNGQRLVAPASDVYSDTVSARVRSTPTVATQVSEASLAPGGSLSDTVKVTGLNGQAATVKADLYGPFATKDKISCDGDAVWSGSIDVPGDGTYVTEATVLPTAGYYTYHESIADSDTIKGVDTKCADAAETTIVHGVPAITTKVNKATVTPGAQLSDTAIVTGLGKLTAPVKVELWGPFDAPDKISCDGTPFKTQTFTANGDGSYKTEPVTVDQAGYYTYHESIEATDAYDAVTTKCGEAAETSLATAAPNITTLASSDVVKPGKNLRDRLRVTGLGKTATTVKVALYGPFASRSEISCDGSAYRSDTLDVKGDGTYRSAPVTVNRVGFYTFRESIQSSPGVKGVTTDCAEVAETSLGRPLIITGRGEHTRFVKVAAAGPRPTRITSSDLGINAPVSPIGIDLDAGALGVSDNIDRIGWWKDGAAPGDSHGSIVLAGHVDSAKRGAGAFYPLKTASRGDVITLRVAGGADRSYRVVSVKQMLKANLPKKIFSSKGPARLTLVTCGGPFDAGTGHYRDNIVVTAVPR